METNHCPTCHAPIPANAPGGFCPACLLRGAEEPPAYGHSAPSLEEIAAAFPRLEVIGLIGQGGMGFVYKVRQPDLDRIVALKILSPELGRDPAFAERFSREARTLGKLHHPNIVTVFEHGKVEQASSLLSQDAAGRMPEPLFYLVMEYVDGVNLRQAMRAGRFTPEQALAIVPGICDALQAAHAQGIWHRDIKPENILLDREGRVKIADFGIARIVGDPQRDFTLTRTGNALGSAAYMAPEQHEKPHEVDHRADIYSLGVVIYEMLTGELPLGRFPAPSQRAAVDARIDEIVFRTLEKERELRQQSATELKIDVQGAANMPVRAMKEPAKRSVAKPVLIGCAALMLIALLVLVVPSLLYFSFSALAKKATDADRLNELVWTVSRKSPESGEMETVELPSKPEASIVSDTKAGGVIIHIGKVPVMMIVGFGSQPDLSAQSGQGRIEGDFKIHGIRQDLRFEMEGGDWVRVNDRDYDLSMGRVLFLHPSGAIDQLDRMPDRVLKQSEIDAFVEGLLPYLQYNYLTPEYAVVAHIRAAEWKNQALFETGGISTRLIGLVAKGGIDVSAAMREWEGLSFLKVIREKGDEAVVRLEDRKSGGEFDVELVRFNGAWQIDSMKPSAVKQ